MSNFHIIPNRGGVKSGIEKTDRSFGNFENWSCRSGIPKQDESLTVISQGCLIVFFEVFFHFLETDWKCKLKFQTSPTFAF